VKAIYDNDFFALCMSIVQSDHFFVIGGSQLNFVIILAFDSDYVDTTLRFDTGGTFLTFHQMICMLNGH